MTQEPIVFVVDDDTGSQRSLAWLIESMGIRVETYARARDFLEVWDPEQPGCLILDVRMPEMSGLELQRLLLDSEYAPPVIFVTGHGDVPMSVRAMKAGAVDFLQKPIDDQVLLDRINEAIAVDAHNRESQQSGQRAREMRRRLTPREGDVMDLLVLGRSLKEIAAQMDISVQTASKHRARVLAKLEADNDVELVRMVLGAA